MVERLQGAGSQAPHSSCFVLHGHGVSDLQFSRYHTLLRTLSCCASASNSDSLSCASELQLDLFLYRTVCTIAFWFLFKSPMYVCFTRPFFFIYYQGERKRYSLVGRHIHCQRILTRIGFGYSYGPLCERSRYSHS